MAGFEQHYAKENLKSLLRATLREVVRTAREQGVATSDIAIALALQASKQMFQRQRNMDLSWHDDALSSLERLRDGIISTREEIIAEVGERNLNARPAKKRTRKPGEKWT